MSSLICRRRKKWREKKHSKSLKNLGATPNKFTLNISLKILLRWKHFLSLFSVIQLIATMIETVWWRNYRLEKSGHCLSSLDSKWQDPKQYNIQRTRWRNSAFQLSPTKVITPMSWIYHLLHSQMPVIIMNWSQLTTLSEKEKNKE